MRYLQSRSSRKAPLFLPCHQSPSSCQYDRTLQSRLCPLSQAVACQFISQACGKARAKFQQYGPSVISSTSPLSPKHLRQQFSQCSLFMFQTSSSVIVAGSPRLSEFRELVKVSSQLCPRLAAPASIHGSSLTQKAQTHCVNFHVREFGSPSTIFSDPPRQLEEPS